MIIPVSDIIVKNTTSTCILLHIILLCLYNLALAVIIRDCYTYEHSYTNLCMLNTSNVGNVWYPYTSTVGETGHRHQLILFGEHTYMHMYMYRFTSIILPQYDNFTLVNCFILVEQDKLVAFLVYTSYVCVQLNVQFQLSGIVIQVFHLQVLYKRKYNVTSFKAYVVVPGRNQAKVHPQFFMI